jgi:hypothetical protein
MMAFFDCFNVRSFHHIPIHLLIILVPETLTCMEVAGNDGGEQGCQRADNVYSSDFGGRL